MTVQTHEDPEVLAFADALRSALNELPVDRQDVVYRKLSAVLLDVHRTGDASSVGRFVQGLQLSARLHANPGYLKAVREADAEIEQEMSEAVPVDQLVAAMRTRHA